jgi:hypothetical protein
MHGRSHPARLALCALVIIVISSPLVPLSVNASYLEIPLNPASYGVTASGFTVEFWIDIQAQPGHDPRIIRCRNPVEGACGNASESVWEVAVCRQSVCPVGTLFFGLQPNGVCYEKNSSQVISNGTYHHVAATYDGSTMRIYLDGTETGNLAASGINVNVTNGILVVGAATDFGNTIECDIDEIRIWSVARTTTQIQAGMAGEIGPTPGLVAYWKLNGTYADETGGPSLSPTGDISFVVLGRYGGAVHIDNTTVTAPASPGPVTASDTDPFGVSLSWANVANEDGYNIYRDGALVATAAANATSATDGPPVGTYNYCVEAFNIAGPSPQACDMGTRTVLTSPASPGPLTASDTDPFAVYLTWMNVANEDGYHIYRNATLIATVGPNITALTNIPAGGTYNYCVEAFNSAGLSPQACDMGTKTGTLPGAPGLSPGLLSGLLFSLGGAGAWTLRRRRK